MAFGGLDPDDFTFGVYYAMLNRAARVKAILNGGGEESERAEAVARDNAAIIASGWFNNLWPDDDSGE